MGIKTIWTGVVKIWKDSVSGNIIAAAIVAVAGTTAWHWWEQIGVALPRIWAYVLADAAVSRWVLWLLILCAVAVAALAVAVALDHVKTKQDGWYNNYTEDEFFFMQWRWRFMSDGQPYNINAFCCACDFQLDIEVDQFASTTTYNCPCGKTNVPFNDTRRRVELRVTKMIQQKIRTGTWNQAIRRS